MNDRINNERICKILKEAVFSNIFSFNDTSLIIYDFSFLKEKINFLIELFPENSIHAIAAKANPLIGVLNLFKGLGTGLETASLPEVYIAENVGFDRRKIVFDSPSKTHDEIEYALRAGIHINADSFSELKRLSQILLKIKANSNIGIRINPQVGSGTILATSVADKISKFGIPIEDHRDEIIEAYKNYSWLNGVHLHIGSQGISMEQLIDGLGKVYDLIELINSKNRQVEYFDIGGGYPVSYGNNTVPKFENYINKIKAHFPNLFKDYTIVTEFGRYISANSAFAISRVEYVKEEQGYKILSIHLGADFLLRKAYSPSDWHHEITVVDKNGNKKYGRDTKKYIVAGPLCFASDVLATDLALPEVEEGDFLVIHDVGAYTLSMWSRYNSRQIPKVLAYDDSTFITMREKESLEDLYNFWK